MKKDLDKPGGAPPKAAGENEAPLVPVIVPAREPRPQLRPSALARHLQSIRSARASRKS